MKQKPIIVPIPLSDFGINHSSISTVKEPTAPGFNFKIKDAEVTFFRWHLSLLWKKK